MLTKLKNNNIFLRQVHKSAISKIRLKKKKDLRYPPNINSMGQCHHNLYLNVPYATACPSTYALVPSAFLLKETSWAACNEWEIPTTVILDNIYVSNLPQRFTSRSVVSFQM